jgi:hypothetical protein
VTRLPEEADKAATRSVNAPVAYAPQASPTRPSRAQDPYIQGVVSASGWKPIRSRSSRLAGTASTWR